MPSWYKLPESAFAPYLSVMKDEEKKKAEALIDSLEELIEKTEDAKDNKEE